jgi:hypothetical protein
LQRGVVVTQTALEVVTLQSRIGANRNRAGNVWIEANIAKLPALLGKP